MAPEFRGWVCPQWCQGDGFVIGVVQGHGFVLGGVQGDVFIRGVVLGGVWGDVFVLDDVRKRHTCGHLFCEMRDASTLREPISRWVLGHETVWAYI